jgi:calcium binding protein 39
MANLISNILKGGKKTPAELVTSTQGHIKTLIENKEKKDEKVQKKSLEKISSNLSQMKFLLYGEADSEPNAENTQKLTELLLSSGVLLQLLEYIKDFEFEARKDVAQLYNYVLRQQKTPGIEYVKQHPEILTMLVKGYNDADIALHCGSVLREIIRHEALNDMLLTNTTLFEAFFEYVQLSTFDVASDAFATFKLMLTKHKVQCAKFLEANFDKVFGKYNVLLQSRNYVTKRQSLKLLGELLLNRSNFNIMMKYINDPNNLKIMMNLLRGNTKAIQFEAFHVFKIFVANPKKARPVLEILVRNKKKLIEFLNKFQKEKEDEQFNDEKGILLATLEKLDDSVLASKEEGKTDAKTDDPKKA